LILNESAEKGLLKQYFLIPVKPEFEKLEFSFISYFFRSYLPHFKGAASLFNHDFGRLTGN